MSTASAVTGPPRAGAAPAPPPAATGGTVPPVARALAPANETTVPEGGAEGAPSARAGGGEGAGAAGELGSGALPPWEKTDAEEAWFVPEEEEGGALGGTAGQAPPLIGDPPGLDYAAAGERVQVQGELLEGAWPPEVEVEAAPPGTGRLRALTVVVATLALLGTLVAATARRPWVRQAVKRWTQPVRVKLHRRMGSFTRRPSAAEIFMSRMNMDRDTGRLV